MADCRHCRRTTGRLVGHRSAFLFTWVRSACKILELCSLSRNQETGRGIIETGALQLANGAGEFGDLRAQLQNPERQGGILHPVPGAISRSLFRGRERNQRAPALTVGLQVCSRDRT
jgi:hypothetical protein